MVKVQKIFFAVIVFFLAIQTFGQNHELICVEVKGQPSKIVDNKRVGVMDTILFLLHGQITKLKEPGENTILKGINIKLKDVVGNVGSTLTEENGNFKIWGEQGVYDLEISTIGMERIFIRRLRLGSGEIRLINAVLGPGTYYEMKEK